jgi:putative N6-adenine-specific DNA methylase
LKRARVDATGGLPPVRWSIEEHVVSSGVKAANPDKRALTRITCSEHVTPHLRREVEALGLEVQEDDAVSVSVGATLAECMALNLRLRTGLHVMWMLTRFRCPSPKALYTHASSYPWESLAPADGYFSITSNVDNPKINNSMYPNLVLKDAIVDRMTKQTGRRPDSGADKSKLVIHLYWKGDRAWVYLNTTGRWLADRGYRRIPHLAPMRETLAAAVLLGIGYDGSRPLVNPMCGAGTLAIEAALIGTGRAPGLLRSGYSFLHTTLDVEERWAEARRSAHKDKRSADPAPIIATDHDPKAVEAAKKNAQAAGVDHLIEFRVCDFADTPIPESPGDVILNPEYGERMGEHDELEQTYARIGDFFKQRCPGWTGHVFTGSRELAKRVGLKADRWLPFNNAQLPCRLLSYDIYASTGAHASPEQAG